MPIIYIPPPVLPLSDLERQTVNCQLILRYLPMFARHTDTHTHRVCDMWLYADM